MKIKFAIIGGGVAGLCAAIRLAELGEKALIIEGGTYPTQKVCGEFLSPECIAILHAWGIHPVAIPQVDVISSNYSLSFPFPSPAGGLSHMELDPALMHLALKLGVKIKTKTRVESFKPKLVTDALHLIHLNNGEVIQAEQVLIATGRIPGYAIKVPEMRYMGFKAHFRNLKKMDNLKMYTLPQAYLGIAPIENHLHNVACLADLKTVKKYKNPQEFIEKLILSDATLKENLTKENNLFESWMIVETPNFGIKHTPNWLDTYFIGDAALTVPPACGNGLALAIIGGKLAAEFATKKHYLAFKKNWKKRCASPLFWSKGLHHILMNAAFNQPLLRVANFFPSICKNVYKMTRQLIK